MMTSTALFANKHPLLLAVHLPLHDFLDAVGNVLQRSAGQTRNGDTACTEHVNMMHVQHTIALIRIQTSEGEHADLLDDVLPVPRAAVRNQRIVQSLSHAQDTGHNRLQFLHPLIEERLVTQNGGNNLRAVHRRVGVHRAHDDLHLAQHAGHRLAILADDVNRADALAVQTHVLGKGLRCEELQTLAGEHAYGVGIVDQITGGKTLIGGIEEGKDLLLHAQVRNLIPLLMAGIHAGGVVSTRVEQEDGALGCIQDILLETLKIKGAGLRLVPTVFAELHTHLTEDSVVVSPCGVRQVQLAARGKLADELSTKAKTTRSGQGLYSAHALLHNHGVILTKEELAGQFLELGQTIDGKVLLVSCSIGEDDLFGLLHNGEVVGLSLIGTISTDSYRMRSLRIVSIPRFTLRGSVSAWQAALTLKIASGGPRGTS